MYVFLSIHFSLASQHCRSNVPPLSLPNLLGVFLAGQTLSRGLARRPLFSPFHPPVSMAESTVKCQSANCINGNPPSKLECPTCAKSALSSSRPFHNLIPCRLGITGSFFCGQECFKAGCTFPTPPLWVQRTFVITFRRGSSCFFCCALPLVGRYTETRFQKTHKLIHGLASGISGLSVESDGQLLPFSERQEGC